MVTETGKITPNAEQQKCIDGINGIYMVLAGPGTGKTFTLSRRIESMLKKHKIKAEEILCLTYSDTAASEMRTKILNLVGNDAMNMSIFTYHSFCYSIMKNFADYFDISPKTKLMDKINKEILAKKCLDDAYSKGVDLSIFHTKFSNYYKAVEPLLKTVENIKRYGLTKEKILSYLKTNEEWGPALNLLEFEANEKTSLALSKGKEPKIKGLLEKIETLKTKIDKVKTIYDIAEKYIEEQKRFNYIDFDDMVKSVVDLAQTDSVFASEAFGRYKYILVDEYQDTSSIQNNLIDIVTEYAENLFVVGDDDQIIYGFQGASLDNCANFLKKYPQTEVICLKENRRSTQTILDFAYKVISRDNFRLENNPDFGKFGISKKLTAKNDKVTARDKKIEYNIFDDEIAENNFVVQKIKDIIKNLRKDESLKDIAVLGRKRDNLDDIAQLLEQAGIPYQKSGNKNIFEIQASVLLYSYLRILCSPKYSVDSQFPLLQVEPFRIDEEDYQFIIKKNRPVNRDFISIIEENSEHKWKNPDKINGFMETFKKLYDLKGSVSLHNFIIRVVNETGILGYYANNVNNTEENILGIKRLIAEAGSYRDIFMKSFMDEPVKRGPYLSDFLDYLDKSYKSDSVPEIEKQQIVKNAVQLVTYHGSKGREFNYVILPWLTENVFENNSAGNSEFKMPLTPHVHADSKTVKLSENYKLLYVAITRARHDLYLSLWTGNKRNQKITSLLSDILSSSELVNTNIIARSDVVEETVKYLSVSKPEIETSDLKDRVKYLKLNSHSFDTYKQCPRKYLYQNVLEIPTQASDSAAINYGIAIHDALQKLVENAQKKGFYLSKEETVQAFYDKLDTFEFESEMEYNNFKDRGTESLEEYYHHITDIPVKNIFKTEYRFDNISYGSMTLKGFADLIIKNDDGTFSIYDYKTGRSKSLTDIAKDKKYDIYYCQLAFYKIAFELANEGSVVSETGLKFVEEEGKDVNICFKDEDINIVKEEMNEVINGIQNLQFEPVNENGDNDEICGECQYRLACIIKRKN